MNKNDLEKGGFMSAHSLSLRIFLGKLQWSEFEAAGHIASTVKKKCNKYHAQLASFLCILEPMPMETVSPSFRVGLPISIN